MRTLIKLALLFLVVWGGGAWFWSRLSDKSPPLGRLAALAAVLTLAALVLDPLIGW